MNDERFPRNRLDDKLKQAGNVQCSAANMQSQLKHPIKRKPRDYYGKRVNPPYRSST